MKSSTWDQRAARADHLARQFPFAVEVLAFFKHVVYLQKDLYFGLGSALADASLADLRRGELPSAMRRAFPKFLIQVASVSPELLANAACSLKEKSPAAWKEAFTAAWCSQRAKSDKDNESEVALTRMFLQPVVEHMAERAEVSKLPSSPSFCPFCGEKPLVGALRPEGDGGKRSLICSMCSFEWECGRILCPFCDERDVDKLAVYSTERFPLVRIETCETCRHYIKTVDLTKTGHAVPVVDEIATLPLSLWAAENGYTKIQTNVLGL
jgi:FdhE protein